jgi:hypothetical protein
MEAGFTITKQGWHLLAKLLAGDKLEISKIMVGSGKVPVGVNPGEITELVRPVALATSTVPQVEDKQVSFIVEYRNDLNGGLAEGFWLNEFGVYANDPDEGEVLLYYATMGDYPQYVAAYNGQAVDVRRYPVVIALSECYNVELKPPAGAWVTFEELAETLKRRGYHSNPNLLINGDFRKPVNRNGKAEYTGADYTIDMWALLDTNASLTYDNGFIVGQGRWVQNLSLEVITVIRGQTITLSLLANGQLFTKTETIPSAVPGSATNYCVIRNVENIQTNNLYLRALPHGIVQVTFYTNTQFPNLQAVKLELGNQQTLAHQDADGNWILNDPPNFDLQYALCSQYSPITGEFVGSQHSNPNLLDNAYWADKDYIINQRGQDEYAGQGFTIDRWANNNDNAFLSLQQDGGILFYTQNGTTAPTPIFFTALEHGPKTGETITFSALCKTNSNMFLLALQENIYKTVRILPSSDYCLVYLTMQLTGSLQWVGFRDTGSSGGNDGLYIKAAKLELGPVQTLAHKDENGNWILNDPPPNKALELAKCQRYQIELKKSNSDSNIGFGIANTTRNVTAFIPLPVSLRNKPIIANQKKVMCMGIFSTGYILQAPVNVSVYSYTSSGIHVNCELMSNDYNFIQGNSYQVYLQLQQSQFLIDANL